MKQSLIQLFAVCFTITLNAQQTFYHYDQDSIYKVPLPEYWNFENTNSGNVKWKIIANTKSKTEFAPTLQLEETVIDPSFKNSDLRTISEEEIRITKQQSGDAITINKAEYLFIQNKEWVRYLMEAKISKKQSIKFLVQKSIHNGKSYSLIFSCNQTLFNQYADTAMSFMGMFRFNNTDKTTYSTKTFVDPSSVDEILKNYTGIYKFQAKDTSEVFTQTIDISYDRNGNYNLKEIREIIITDDNKRYIYSFEATLNIESINKDSIVLSTDAIIKEDPFINWTKGVYKLYNKTNALTGNFYSKNNAFKSYQIALTRIDERPPSNVQKTDKVVKSVRTSSEKINAILKAEKTYQDPYSANDKDAEIYIQKYGQGKVKRIGNKYEFTLNSGQKLIFDYKSTVIKRTHDDYVFIGYSDELNNYLLAEKRGGSGDVLLLNRETGEISDLIYLDDLKNGLWTPDRKWMAKCDRTWIEGSYASIIIYTGNDVFIEKYRKDVDDWVAGEVKWLDNKTLEIKKMSDPPKTLDFEKEPKLLGVTYMTFQNGKWIMTNTKPKISNTNITEPGATLVKGYETSPGDDKMPYNPPPKKLGGKDGNELGQLVFKAIKTNDWKLFHSLCLNGTEEEAKNALQKIRTQLEEDGLADWSKTKFSRVTYSKENLKNSDRILYQFFNIEFNYETDFIGYIRGNLNHGRFELLSGKYSLLWPLNEGVLLRK